MKRPTNNSLLVKGGGGARRQSQCDRCDCAAWGLSCELGKPDLSASSPKVAPLGFPDLSDNPRASGAAPFSKGEFLATRRGIPPTAILPASRA
jgi:hypothetical protein